ncbi:hypothetical protein SCHPADRAFT_177330 [Schizopora paradoxa]|uniref:Uncharacterized protein n=1 Tax=Schizopora paradoxa TaxID=27342 RepID=A0A0H2RZM6_9AGAM|nr:hypothetical protein SCHPADRAFT_177330 [Schizopora paradoxa]
MASGELSCNEISKRGHRKPVLVLFVLLDCQILDCQTGQGSGELSCNEISKRGHRKPVLVLFVLLDCQILDCQTGQGGDRSLLSFVAPNASSSPIAGPGLHPFASRNNEDSMNPQRDLGGGIDDNFRSTSKSSRNFDSTTCREIRATTSRGIIPLDQAKSILVFSSYHRHIRQALTYSAVLPPRGRVSMSPRPTLRTP